MVPEEVPVTIELLDVGRAHVDRADARADRGERLGGGTADAARGARDTTPLPASPAPRLQSVTYARGE